MALGDPGAASMHAVAEQRGETGEELHPGPSYLCITQVPGTAVTCSTTGRFRHADVVDVVLGKGDHLQLVVDMGAKHHCTDSDDHHSTTPTHAQTVFALPDQPVFGNVLDLQTYPKQGDRVLDTLLLLSDAGKICFLDFNSELQRFVLARTLSLEAAGVPSPLACAARCLAVCPETGSLAALSPRDDVVLFGPHITGLGSSGSSGVLQGAAGPSAIQEPGSSSCCSVGGSGPAGVGVLYRPEPQSRPVQRCGAEVSPFLEVPQSGWHVLGACFIGCSNGEVSSSSASDSTTAAALQQHQRRAPILAVLYRCAARGGSHELHVLDGTTGCLVGPRLLFDADARPHNIAALPGGAGAVVVFGHDSIALLDLLELCCCPQPGYKQEQAGQQQQQQQEAEARMGEGQEEEDSMAAGTRSPPAGGGRAPVAATPAVGGISTWPLEEEEMEMMAEDDGEGEAGGTAPGGGAGARLPSTYASSSSSPPVSIVTLIDMRPWPVPRTSTTTTSAPTAPEAEEQEPALDMTFAAASPASSHDHHQQQTCEVCGALGPAAADAVRCWAWVELPGSAPTTSMAAATAAATAAAAAAAAPTLQQQQQQSSSGGPIHCHLLLLMGMASGAVHQLLLCRPAADPVSALGGAGSSSGAWGGAAWCGGLAAQRRVRARMAVWSGGAVLQEHKYYTGVAPVSMACHPDGRLLLAASCGMLHAAALPHASDKHGRWLVARSLVTTAVQVGAAPLRDCAAADVEGSSQNQIIAACGAPGECGTLEALSPSELLTTHLEAAGFGGVAGMWGLTLPRARPGSTLVVMSFVQGTRLLLMEDGCVRDVSSSVNSVDCGSPTLAAGLIQQQQQQQHGRAGRPPSLLLAQVTPQGVAVCPLDRLLGEMARAGNGKPAGARGGSGGDGQEEVEEEEGGRWQYAARGPHSDDGEVQGRAAKQERRSPLVEAFSSQDDASCGGCGGCSGCATSAASAAAAAAASAQGIGVLPDHCPSTYKRVASCTSSRLKDMLDGMSLDGSSPTASPQGGGACSSVESDGAAAAGCGNASGAPLTAVATPVTAAECSTGAATSGPTTASGSSLGRGGPGLPAYVGDSSDLDMCGGSACGGGGGEGQHDGSRQPKEEEEEATSRRSGGGGGGGEGGGGGAAHGLHWRPGGGVPISAAAVCEGMVVVYSLQTKTLTALGLAKGGSTHVRAGAPTSGAASSTSRAPAKRKRQGGQCELQLLEIARTWLPHEVSCLSVARAGGGPGGPALCALGTAQPAVLLLALRHPPPGCGTAQGRSTALDFVTLAEFVVDHDAQWQLRGSSGASLAGSSTQGGHGGGTRAGGAAGAAPLGSGAGRVDVEASFARLCVPESLQLLPNDYANSGGQVRLLVALRTGHVLHLDVPPPPPPPLVDAQAVMGLGSGGVRARHMRMVGCWRAGTLPPTLVPLPTWFRGGAHLLLCERALLLQPVGGGLGGGGEGQAGGAVTAAAASMGGDPLLSLRALGLCDVLHATPLASGPQQQQQHGDFGLLLLCSTLQGSLKVVELPCQPQHRRRLPLRGSPHRVVAEPDTGLLVVATRPLPHGGSASGGGGGGGGGPGCSSSSDASPVASPGQPGSSSGGGGGSGGTAHQQQQQHAKIQVIDPHAGVCAVYPLAAGESVTCMASWRMQRQEVALRNRFVMSSPAASSGGGNAGPEAGEFPPPLAGFPPGERGPMVPEHMARFERGEREEEDMEPGLGYRRRRRAVQNLRTNEGNTRFPFAVFGAGGGPSSALYEQRAVVGPGSSANARMVGGPMVVLGTGLGDDADEGEVAAGERAVPPGAGPGPAPPCRGRLLLFQLDAGGGHAPAYSGGSSGGSSAVPAGCYPASAKCTAKLKMPGRVRCLWPLGPNRLLVVVDRRLLCYVAVAGRLLREKWVTTPRPLMALDVTGDMIAAGDQRGSVSLYRYDPLTGFRFVSADRRGRDASPGCCLMDQGSRRVMMLERSAGTLFCLASEAPTAASPERNLRTAEVFSLGRPAGRLLRADLRFRGGSLVCRYPGDSSRHDEQQQQVEVQGSAHRAPPSLPLLVAATSCGSVRQLVPLHRHHHHQATAAGAGGDAGVVLGGGGEEGTGAAGQRALLLLLQALEEAVAVHPITRPLSGHDHRSYRAGDTVRRCLSSAGTSSSTCTDICSASQQQAAVGTTGGAATQQGPNAGGAAAAAGASSATSESEAITALLSAAASTSSTPTSPSSELLLDGDLLRQLLGLPLTMQLQMAAHAAVQAKARAAAATAAAQDAEQQRQLALFGGQWQTSGMAGMGMGGGLSPVADGPPTGSSSASCSIIPCPPDSASAANAMNAGLSAILTLQSIVLGSV